MKDDDTGGFSLTPPKEKEEDPTGGFSLEPPKEYGALESGVEGFRSGARMGWNDEIQAAAEASGLPKAPSFVPWALNEGMYEGGIKPVVGAARMLSDYVTGNKEGTATERYNKGIKEIRERQAEMQKQHPLVYGGSELAGGLGSAVAAPEVKGANMLIRAGKAAGIGAGYGAVSGAGEGEGVEDRAKNAAVGGVGGGVLGGVFAPVMEGIIKGASPLVQKYVQGPYNAWKNSEDEALRRGAGLIKSDQPRLDAKEAATGVRPAVKEFEFNDLQAQGEPVMLADMGGANTEAGLRTAGNLSPEAHEIIETPAKARFDTAKDRAAETVRSFTTNDANAAKTRAQLEAEYDLERKPAYTKAYEEGDKPIISTELERVLDTPSGSGALRSAIDQWRDFQYGSGYGAMNPPLRVTADGRIENVGGAGIPPYPNLQLWDYASRALKTQIENASPTEKARLTPILKGMLSELDKAAPSFKAARGVAAQYFGGINAMDAGEEAFKNAGKKFNAGVIKLQMAKMQPAEREMFQEAFANSYANSLAEGRGKLPTTKPERERMEAVFGKEGLEKLDARRTLEETYDRARRSQMGSQTFKNAVMSGILGATGGVYGYNKEGLQGAAAYGALGAGLPQAGKIAGKAVLSYAEKDMPQKITTMLTSGDKGLYDQGIKLLANNKTLRDALPRIQATVDAAIGQKALAPSSKFIDAIKSYANPEQRARGGAVKSIVKLSHKSVNYSKGHGKEFCHTCKFSDHKPRPNCDWVKDIKPDGWCELWKQTGKADGGPVDDDPDVLIEDGSGHQYEKISKHLQAPPDYMPGSWPKSSDVTAARINDLSYGDPIAPYTTVGKANIRSTPIMEVPRFDTEGVQEPAQSMLTHDPESRSQANRITRQWLAARRTPVAQLGFDPSKAIESPPSFFTLNKAGIYDPQTDQYWNDSRYETAAVHESIHRGIQALRKSGNMPKTAIPEEFIVRGLMSRHYGDIEAGHGSVSKEQVDVGHKVPRDTLDRVEAAAAQRLAEKKPRGPR